jgi:hypothetical protein
MATTPPPIGSSTFNSYLNVPSSPSNEATGSSPQKRKASATGFEEHLTTRASASTESANKRPRTALQTAAPAAPKTSKEIAEDVIKNAPKSLSNDHKSRLRNLQKWLDRHHNGTTLVDIRDGCGTAGAYGNSLVTAWLDAPAEENPYGRQAKAKNSNFGGGSGASAITALLKAYGKPF